MTRYEYIIIITVLFLGGYTRMWAQGGAHASDRSLEVLLTELDSLLVRSPKINEGKDARLAQLAESFRRAGTTEQRYWMAANLYEEYSAYDSDSAMAYANRALELARAMERPDLVTDMELNRAYLYSATGLLDASYSTLSKINHDSLNTEQEAKYYDRMLYLSSHRDQYIGDHGRNTAYPAEIDSLLQKALQRLPEDDPRYNWLRGWGNFKDESHALEAIASIRPAMDTASFTTRQDAMNAWMLSKLYEYAHNPEMKLKYLILSAQADVQASNKEIASLEELGKILLDNGDIDRANTYITYCLKCANEYRSRIRLSSLASMQEQAMSQIHQRNDSQNERNRIQSRIMTLLAAVLLLALLYIYRQFRLLRRSRAEVASRNEELRKGIAELQQTREELRRSNEELARRYAAEHDRASDLSAGNEVKEKYIANIFEMCSDYINKLDDFRKNIYRMIVARRFDEISALTKDQEISQSEIKELYANFDNIFLQLYPDFVTDFNSLLRPEEQITLRKPGQLTTELRIYALVRLGLNDSVKIARFLHVSPQTVYNTRQRTRNKAIIPRENFAEAVARLGKPAF